LLFSLVYSLSLDITDLCDEFKEIALYACNQLPYPFPLKKGSYSAELPPFGTPSLGAAPGKTSVTGTPAGKTKDKTTHTPAHHHEQHSSILPSPEMARRSNKKKDSLLEEAIHAHDESLLPIHDKSGGHDMSFDQPIPFDISFDQGGFGGVMSEEKKGGQRDDFMRRSSLFEKFSQENIDPAKLNGREWVENIDKYILTSVEEKKNAPAEPVVEKKTGKSKSPAKATTSNVRTNFSLFSYLMKFLFV
jgi:hypothetical protein